MNFFHPSLHPENLTSRDDQDEKGSLSLDLRRNLLLFADTSKFHMGGEIKKKKVPEQAVRRAAGPSVRPWGRRGRGARRRSAGRPRLRRATAAPCPASRRGGAARRGAG